MRVFTSADEIKAAVGEELGVSDWFAIDQKRINLFAEATGDHQWIHVDEEQAKSGPYGTTIAHGYLTLSLLAPLMKAVYDIQGAKRGINYGLNRVRFPSPVPVDSEIRVRVTLKEVEEVPGGVQSTWGAVVERKGGDKPACVAESITRHYF